MTKLDDILVEDLPNAWCEDCEHPVCLSKRKSFKQEMKDLFLELILDAPMRGLDQDILDKRDLIKQVEAL